MGECEELFVSTKSTQTGESLDTISLPAKSKQFTLMAFFLSVQLSAEGVGQEWFNFFNVLFLKIPITFKYCVH